jgi:hypothetical protein
VTNPRVTEFEQDRTSLYRKLDEGLYLVVKRKEKHKDRPE